MFLHSGASLHGHEFSKSTAATSQQPASSPLRSPLLRSPFSSVAVAAPSSSKPAPALGPLNTQLVDGPSSPPLVTPAVRRRQRAQSDLSPRLPEPVVRFLELNDQDSRGDMREDGLVSESEFSDATHQLDGMAALARHAAHGHNHHHHRKPRIPRRSTTYFFGYPAPKVLGPKKVMQKVLPRLLLQLQRASGDGRSIPVLEVFPSSRIAGPVITPRLARRFPGIFGAKRQLGYDDIVLVKRDDRNDGMYDGPVESEHDDGFEERNLVAVCSPLKNSDEAEIILDDGAVWVAKPLPNGSYDFVHVDAQGNITTARWARRNPMKAPRTGYSVKSSVTTPASPSAAAAAPSRFTFSILNPLTRRHPVMATLTPSSLDVQDTYTSLSPHSQGPPRSTLRPIGSRTVSMTETSQPLSGAFTVPNSPSKRSSMTSMMSTDNESDSGVAMTPMHEKHSRRNVHIVDDATKTLISVTAVWVALRSGWSPNYTPSSSWCEISGKERRSNSPPAKTGRRRHTWSRNHGGSASNDGGRQTPQQQLSEPEAPTPRPGRPVKRHSFPLQPTSPLATGADSQDYVGLMSPGLSVSSGTTAPALSDVNGGVRGLQRRATSTGAAFMQRHLNLQALEAAGDTASGSARKNHGGISVTTIPCNDHRYNPLTPLTPAIEESSSSGGTPVVVQMEDAGTGRVSPKPRPMSDLFGISRRGTKKQKDGRKSVDDEALGGKTASRMRSRLSRWFHKLGAR